MLHRRPTSDGSPPPQPELSSPPLGSSFGEDPWPPFRSLPAAAAFCASPSSPPLGVRLGLISQACQQQHAFCALPSCWPHRHGQKVLGIICRASSYSGKASPGKQVNLAAKSRDWNLSASLPASPWPVFVRSGKPAARRVIGTCQQPWPVFLSKHHMRSWREIRRRQLCYFFISTIVLFFYFN
jgi:hypothetical protein